MVEPIRTFIAIELNELVHRALGDLLEALQREHAARYVRWVAPASIHVTLKFLGDVDADQMPAVLQIVAGACAGVAPFDFSIQGIGAFPNAQRPNVIWVGAQGEIEPAARLAEKIDAGCATLGFPREERSFAPHLTLGRVKRDCSPNDRRFVGEMIAKTQVGVIGQVQVARVSVMKSELRPGGSVYARLSAVELKDGGRKTKDE